MKTNKLIVCLLIAMMMPVATYARDKGGNGGDAVVCRNASGMITTAETLDRYEARTLRGLTAVWYPAIPVKEQDYLDEMLRRLAIFSSERADAYRGELGRFNQNSNFLPGQQLVDISDSDHLALPTGCVVEQLVIQQKPRFPEDKRYTINSDIWQRLSAEDTAIIKFHEVMLGEMTSDCADCSSIHTRDLRYLNSIIFSGKILAFQYFAQFFDVAVKAEDLKYDEHPNVIGKVLRGQAGRLGRSGSSFYIPSTYHVRGLETVDLNSGADSVEILSDTDDSVKRYRFNRAAALPDTFDTDHFEKFYIERDESLGRTGIEVNSSEIKYSGLYSTSIYNPDSGSYHYPKVRTPKCEFAPLDNVFIDYIFDRNDKSLKSVKFKKRKKTDLILRCGQATFQYPLSDKDIEVQFDHDGYPVSGEIVMNKFFSNASLTGNGKPVFNLNGQLTSIIANEMHFKMPLKYGSIDFTVVQGSEIDLLGKDFLNIVLSADTYFKSPAIESGKCVLHPKGTVLNLAKMIKLGASLCNRNITLIEGSNRIFPEWHLEMIFLGKLELGYDDFDRLTTVKIVQGSLSKGSGSNNINLPLMAGSVIEAKNPLLVTPAEDTCYKAEMVWCSDTWNRCGGVAWRKYQVKKGQLTDVKAMYNKDYRWDFWKCEK